MAIRKPTISHAELRKRMRDEDEGILSSEAASPSQSKTRDGSGNIKADPAEENRAPVDPAPPAKANKRPKQQSSAQCETSNTAVVSERQTIAVTAPIPERGVSKLFDALLKNHDEQEALRLVLNKALPLYETALLDGSFQKSLIDYPARSTTATTRRSLKHEAINVAKQAFDPLDVYTANKIGRIIATAALAAFFENEKQK
ncbi:VirC2 family conjugal transfer protein [Roseibium sp. HPY-6]|uniref:VirC2 family conjugal transfer protein n=1 Tax=Roseibium sp. HPY-6 TaxID=3229852 RepID=UPI003390780C